MAVQAHCSSNAFAHDFRDSRIQSSAMVDELRLIHNMKNINNSEMKTTTTTTKKRIRDDEPSMMSMMAPQIYANPGEDVVPVDQTDRLVEPSAASTSGRRSLDLVGHLYNQSVEIDALIRLQNERLRLGMEERQKRHCTSLVSVFEHHLRQKLREKELELENAMRKNSELEERVQRMSLQSQIWFNIARNNEAVAANLKASLDQAMLLQISNAAAGAAASNGAVGPKEGYGDSDGTAAEEAESCRYEGDEERIITNGPVRGGCRLCGAKDVSVLLLPCRHLCLCSACDPKADTCPVCHVGRNASLQVFMS